MVLAFSLRRTGRRIRRRFSQLDFRLGLRLTVAALAAMLLGKLLGLRAFYWAGISAIVVSTGTPGGSFSASLTRFGGSLVGLGSGLLAVLLLGHSLSAAAFAIPLAILLCQAIGLKAAVKMAALSTLFPISAVVEAHGLTMTLETVLARAENVVLGCGVTLLIDGVFWPERSVEKLGERLRRDVAAAGALAGELFEAYVGGPAPADSALLQRLQDARLEHRQLLQEVGAEPEDAQGPRAWLELQVEALHLLVDHVAALQGLQRQAVGDRAPGLMAAPLRAFASSLRATARGFAEGEAPFAAELSGLKASSLDLETAYEGVRRDRGTQEHASQEVFRLLGVLYLCGALVKAIEALTRPEMEAEQAEG